MPYFGAGRVSSGGWTGVCGVAEELGVAEAEAEAVADAVALAVVVVVGAVEAAADTVAEAFGALEPSAVALVVEVLSAPHAASVSDAATRAPSGAPCLMAVARAQNGHGSLTPSALART